MGLHFTRRFTPRLWLLVWLAAGLLMSGCHLMQAAKPPKKLPTEFSCGEKCPPGRP
jgi:hypothetical protein